jgi:ABC-type oligopeptide transport system substrate-binding subunit
VSDGSGQDRALLRKAVQLLNEAGYPIKDGKRDDCRTGEPLTIEFLLEEPSFQPHHMPYIKNLAERSASTQRCGWSTRSSSRRAPTNSISTW